MYTLMSGLWKYMFQKDEFFVIILGLDNAGKTTYLEQTKTKFNKKYKSLNLLRITTTVGLNIGKIDIGSSRLNFWDLGGQEELQSLWDKYYAESHGIIYIIDSADSERLHESKQAFEKLITSEALEGVPLLVLCNKQDLHDVMTVADIRKVFHECSHLIGQRERMMAGISALKGEGIQEGIEWLEQSIQRNAVNRPPTVKEIT